MKKLLLSLSLVALVGCGTLTQTDCEKAVKVYNNYLELVTSSGVVSDLDVARAKLAADFLQANCGWFPVAKHKALAIRDSNGVILLAKP